MKKLILLICFLLLSSIATAKEIKIITTIGQITDLTEEIGQDHVTVIGLMGAGVDPHLYKATESDVRKLSSANIIFYNGLNLESKMQHIFEKMGMRIMTVALADNIDKNDLLDSENYVGHYDPHIWFDIPKWMKVVEMATEQLSKFDPEHKADYYQNASRYLDKLADLHKYVQDRASEIPEEKRILITAHDAFRYFGEAYGFKVLGLQGVSTESEAGTKDVRELADYIAEKKINAIFVESSVPERNIKAVQEAVKARGWNVVIGGELFSDAMGSKGTFEGTYIGMIRHNIDTIVDGLKN